MIFPTVSAIVCAYNEEKTVKPILEVLLGHQRIDEVIVVDDGSTDRTGEIIDSINNDKLVKIHHQNNLGKGAAAASAVKASKGRFLLFADADLINFHPLHVDLLLSPLLIEPNCMTIGVREPYHTHEKIFERLLRSFGGERALSKQRILPVLKKLETSGYGIEAILNLRQIHQGRPIYYVPLPNLIHKIKQEKHPLYKYITEYFKENKDIVKQYLNPENKAFEAFLKQLTSRLGI